MADRSRVVDEVERYWFETGLSDDDIAEMRSELEAHLEEAASEGKTADDIIGNRAVFAESWATERRGRDVPAWEDVRSGKTRRERATKKDLILYGAGTAAVVAAAFVAGQGGSDVENEVWRWVWTIFAIVMGIGEIFTAGFFLLPFAIGAAVAAVLAWLNVVLLAQWLVFFGVSMFALAFLQRFISRQDEGDQPRVGANRWIGSEGVVLDAIDPHSGAGMVRILNEEWRATSLHPIEAGAKIIVTEVDGARLVVEKLETS